MSGGPAARPSALWFRLHRTAAVVADLVPVSWALRLRRSYLAGGGRAGTPVGRRLRRMALDVVRLGGIPQTDPFRVPGRPDVRMVPSDSYITNHLFWLGIDSYEAGEPFWWATLVESHASTLELGANVGLYTVVGAAAAAGRPYVAVEPNPESCAVLRRNITVNGLDDVCIVEGAVVGSREASTVTLRFPDRDLYGASAGAFVEGALDLATSADRSVTVPAVAAADLVAGVDLIKLDIEGFEVEVLSSVSPWIVAEAPTLVVEVRDDAVHLQRLVADLVDAAGYACAAVVHGAVQRLPVAEASAGRLEARFHTRDVTLIAPDRLDDLLTPA